MWRAPQILTTVTFSTTLTRNFDKQRGFVNGATGTVCESLAGNAVFTVKLHGTGNLVLVYPMEEDGALFLPCCYGYATTIRRAQGASLVQGCIWFNQKRYAAGAIEKRHCLNTLFIKAEVVYGLQIMTRI